MTIDVFLATKDPEAYELKRSRTFAVMLITSSITLSITVELLRYLNLLSIVFMPLVVLIANGCAVFAMYFIYKTNKRKLKVYEQSLSNKYQVSFLVIFLNI